MGFIEAEARRAFGRAEAPRYPFPLSEIVECLFGTLHHQLGDPELDAVGGQVLQALASYHDRSDFLNLPDRLEAFLKFTQHLLKQRPASRPPGTSATDRMFLPEVLQALGLASASGLGMQSLAQLEGKPRFAWYIERAVQARNEVHRAPIYAARDKAEIFESVCVVMLFAIAERKQQIGLALLASTHRGLLERYRNSFDKWRERFVDLEGREQLTDQFEGIDPLAVEVLDEPAPREDDPADPEGSVADSPPDPQVPDQRRGLVRDLVRTIPKLVLLGDPGAGKTTTLQYLGWHAANGLLKDPGGDWWFPIYLPLKAFASAGSSTIEAAILSETEGVSLKQLASQRCLFLLDGLNEVPQEYLLAAKHQIQSLLSLGDNVHVVITCRPGQFQNEFGLPVFDLQPLKDEQIRHFFQRHLHDNEKVRALMALVKRQPKLWEWARNPFMLAMLVRVFHRHGTLPRNRGSLLKAFLADIMRREQVQGAARTSLATKTTLLARLAFETRKLALLSFSRIDACAWLKQKRDELGSTLDVPLFIDEILNNNLLALTSGGLLTFDHELYQEYFCAVALLELGEAAGPLIQELQEEPRWEEPIILYSGICDHRSALLHALAAVNVRLAAKSLTSAAVEEWPDREIILLKAETLTAQATDSSQVAEGLLSLAELGEAEAMVTVLRQRGAQDTTARQAIQSFIPKCPPDLVVGWMQRTSDLSDKFLITWMLAAIAPDQKEILLRDHREPLKELLLWQVRRSRQGGTELRHLRRLLSFFGPEFNICLARSLTKDILARVDYGDMDQWHALHYVAQDEAAFISFDKQAELFTAALNRCHPDSLNVAVLIWSRHLSGRDLSFICDFAEDEVLRRSMRSLRKAKHLTNYQLALSLARALRVHRGRCPIETRDPIKTNSLRLERLAKINIGEIRACCSVTQVKDFGAFVQLEPGIDGLLHPSDMRWEPVTAPGPPLDTSTRLDVVVLEIDDATGNVLVGLKQMTFALWDIAQSRYPVGTKVTVKVLTAGDDAVLVEIEPGLQGVIARKDLSWDCHSSPTGVLTVGQQIEVLVCAIDSDSLTLFLSRRLLEPDPWETVETLYPVGSTVSGKVINLVDFGAFIALPRGIDGLLHLADMSWGNLKNPARLLHVGQTIELLVLDVNKEKKRISLGLKQRMPNPWDAVETNYPVGTKVKGQVVNLVPYGAFVELEPGVEGLLHVTELSWTKRVVKPSDVLNKGQEIEALVLEINSQDRKISLGLRQLEPSPWAKASEEYPPGTRVKGIVRNLTSYGAFVGLGDGIDGMIHLSDISWARKINHPSEVFKKADEVEAVVLSVDNANQRIALGMKQLIPDPWESIETYYQIGNIITGTINKLSNFGAFVPLSHDIDGLIHISEISEERVDKVKNVLQVGQEITARVISIDKAQRRIGLSLRLAKTAT